MIDSGKSNGIRRSAGLALMLGAGLALGACSTMSDMGEATSEGVSKVADAVNPFNWFGSKDGDKDASGAQQDSDTAQHAKQERAVAATATKTGMKSAPHDALTEQMATASDEDHYPKLSTVPDRPKAAMTKKAEKERQELRDGLVADTANARYTDKELRAQTTPAAAPQASDLSRSNERIAGETPATPAPTMPVSATPAAALPAAPAPVQTAAITPPSVPQRHPAAGYPRAGAAGRRLGRARSAGCRADAFRAEGANRAAGVARPAGARASPVRAQDGAGRDDLFPGRLHAALGERPAPCRRGR